MSQSNDGGAAFPTHREERVYVGERDRLATMAFVPVGGMTLLDYLAAHADLVDFHMPKKSAEIVVGRPQPPEDDILALLQWSAELTAKLRYGLAIAMLAEKERLSK